MDGKNTILRGLVEGIVKELYPQTSVYNVRVDDTTMLAQKLAEMISALNGKVTQQQLADAIEQALSELGAVKGEKGDPGVGIKSVVQTGTSNVDGGTNVITVTLDDGTSSSFQVRNGGKGIPGEPGAPGVAGIGIEKVEQTTASNADSGTNVVTIMLTDGSTATVNIKNGSKGSKGDPGDTGVPGIPGPKGDPGDPGEDGVGVRKVEQTTTSNTDGGSNVVTVTLTDGTTSTFSVKNGSKGSKGDPGEKGDPGDPGDSWTVTPYDYGYTGSGDATSAIQQAMANNRRVFIPGGDYTVSGELLIRDNCQLELAQDAVLYFKQTSGNCISLKQCAWLKGNHATVSVPYTFTGKVLNADTDLTTAVNDCPPFKKWDPMWKNGRYVTDLNIVKPDTRGFYYSMDGSCNGTAVYLCADGEDVTTWLWGVNYSGLRIAGAFTYGVHAENFNFEEGDGGWNHEMRIEAFIDGAETGVRLDNCHNAYLSTIVQPRRAYTTSEVYVPYAKYGIYLNESRNCDLSGSRVWDWDSEKTLWTEGGIYQHLALIGDCRGLITNEYYYYSNPNYDIRDLIYTDTPGNLERMIILQEPFTRWYKPIDHEPYFFDGDDNKKLALKDDLDCIVDGERKPAFTNALLTATDTDGSIYNGTGYTKYGYQLNASGNVVEGVYTGCTGFIPIKQNDVIYAKNITLDNTNVVVVTYDANKSYITHGTSNTLAGMTYFFDYVPTDDGFTLKVKERSTTAYIRFCYRRDRIGERPIISVNQPIEYVNNGYLRETIKVKASQVEGLPSGGSGADLLDENGIIKEEYLPDLNDAINGALEGMISASSQEVF